MITLERRIMRPHRHFIVFVILILLATVSLAALHSHGNTADDHGCPICLVSNHQYAADLSAAVYDGVPAVATSVHASPQAIFSDHIFFSVLSNRAPPV